MITCLFRAAFLCPSFILIILGGVSAASLAAALTAQYAFGLLPCDFCLYQRIPFAVVVMLSLLGLMAVKAMGRRFGIFNMILCGIALLINSGIAFYHVGVEQHWWASACSLGDITALDPEAMKDAITNAPRVSCDQIPWQMFGISMAGYNVMLCLGLGLYALIASRTAAAKV